MLKQILKRNDGLTFIELIVVLAIIGIITIFFVINTEPDERDQIREVTENLAQDFRFVRSVATSRQAHTFQGDTESQYPPGGYGIVFRSSTENKYYIAAFKDNTGTDYEVVKTVDLPPAIDIRGATTTPAQYAFYYAQESEREAHTNLAVNTGQSYDVLIGRFNCTGICHRGLVSISEISDDDSIIPNIGLGYYSETVSIPGTTCFPAGVKVLMADKSEKNIEDIKVGDMVMGNIDGQMKASRVHEIEAPIREGYYEVYLVNGKILRVTGEHPIYARGETGHGWASVEPPHTELEIGRRVHALGDMKEVYTSDGSWTDIEHINYVKGEIQTYNLKNIDGHLFYADSVLVHNKKLPVGGGGYVP